MDPDKPPWHSGGWDNTQIMCIEQFKGPREAFVWPDYVSRVHRFDGKCDFIRSTNSQFPTNQSIGEVSTIDSVISEASTASKSNSSESSNVERGACCSSTTTNVSEDTLQWLFGIYDSDDDRAIRTPWDPPRQQNDTQSITPRRTMEMTYEEFMEEQRARERSWELDRLNRSSVPDADSPPIEIEGIKELFSSHATLS